MSVTVVDFQVPSVGDIPGGLRRLADEIEAGRMPADLFAYVAKINDGGVTAGCLGKSPSAGADAHLAFACGMRLLENQFQL